jgi:hypothetical protein
VVGEQQVPNLVARQKLPRDRGSQRFDKPQVSIRRDREDADSHAFTIVAVASRSQKP